MRVLRPVLSISVLCIVIGLGGGLVLGRLLSGGQSWQTPAPWLVYAAALVLAVGALSWLEVRRTPRNAQPEVEEDPWPLPPDYGSELDLLDPPLPDSRAVEPVAEQHAGEPATAAAGPDANETINEPRSALKTRRKSRRAVATPIPAPNAESTLVAVNGVEEPLASGDPPTPDGVDAGSNRAVAGAATAAPAKRARRTRSRRPLSGTEADAPAVPNDNAPSSISEQAEPAGLGAPAVDQQP